jgi:hypothetical protein
MKKNALAILLGIVFLSSCVIYVPYEGEQGQPEPRAPREDRYDRSYDEYPDETDTGYFYEYLAPYGVWVSYSPYGYVWIPRRIGPRWRPYTYGRWAWTNYGWTWVSYDAWGWAPFHYGRWGWDRRLGWFWVPGNVWAPAWVTWRWGNLYIGWAPLPPDVEFVAGVGVRSLPYDFPHNHWVFIEGRHFQHDYLDRYVLPYERSATLVNFTVHKSNLAQRNRQIFNEGVDVEQVRRVIGNEVSRYQLEEARRPGESRVSGDAVSIYRPVVRKNETARPKTALQKEEAEERAPEIRREQMERQYSGSDMERRLRNDQDEEMQRVEETQKREEAELRRRAEDEKRLASGNADKEKAQKDYEVKANELKKQHQEEKTKIAERHQEEEKTVKGGRIKKKEQN